MDIDLARKFLLEFLPSDAQVPVQEVFEAMKATPLLVLNNALITASLGHLKDPNKIKSVACANGFISGFALAYCMEKPEVSKMLQGYLDEAAKTRGENIINFTQKRGI